ncbi:MAG TPA: VOC family protein [Gemmatimonadales bacterium]|nr:VOC family protein [Gemmatimonadales bacterium]
MQVNPYLNFNGNCAEAFRLYEKVLGGKIVTLTTHRESPIADQVPAHWGDRVLHARLVVGDTILMASDSPPEHYTKPSGIHVSLQVEDPAEADRIFYALADQGSVTMPIDKTFWAERFGMLVDRFDIPWMINCEQPAEGARQKVAASGRAGGR